MFIGGAGETIDTVLDVINCCRGPKRGVGGPALRTCVHDL
jgi:hypothetical protein